MELSKNILENFEYSKQNIDEFSLWYKMARFVTNKVELLAYSMRTKDFIFFVDEDKVENYISVYKAKDSLDGSKWIIIEFLVWESKQKEIIFMTNEKMYIITESKWWKIIHTTIITDEYKQEKLLSIINNDLEFVRNKVDKYKNKLKYRGYLKKEVSEKVVNNFKLNFLSLKLQTS